MGKVKNVRVGRADALVRGMNVPVARDWAWWLRGWFRTFRFETITSSPSAPGARAALQLRRRVPAQQPHKRRREVMRALDPAVPALPEHKAMLIPRIIKRLICERPATVRVVEIVLPRL